MIRNSFLSLAAFIILTSFIYIFPSSQVNITGYVYDSQGQALIGANITEKGTKIGTTTDFNGKYLLTVNSLKSTIVISYTGFRTEEIKLKNVDLSKPIKTILKESQKLEEVIITSGEKSKKWRQSEDRESPPATMDMAVGQSNYKTHKERKLDYHEKTPPEAGNYDKIQENAFYSPLDNPLSTLSIDVDRASYSNVRRFLEAGTMPNQDAVRIEEMINYFNYSYPAPSRNATRPFNTDIELTACPWNSDHKLMRVGLQAQNFENDNIPASNLVFLIDVSGSMNSANKLPLLKSSFKLLTSQLRPEDKIAIVVYAGAAGCVLESTPGNEKAKIMEAFDKLKAGGSTAGAAGIQLAYQIAEKQFIQGGNNRVILATDGDFNVGTSGDDALITLIEEQRKKDVFLSILGFGVGNYMEGKMQKIAQAGNGNHSYIDNMKEAKKVLMDEFSGTMFTIAKDVKIQIEFNPNIVEGYRMVGYENRVLAAKDFNDDTKDAGEMGAGHSVTVLYEIIPVGSKSSFTTTIDPLKYQNNKKDIINKDRAELGTIKYRFKTPTGKKSTKSEEVIIYKPQHWNSISDDTKWAALTAEFGMLLRKSKYIADGNYEQLISDLKSTINNKSDQHKAEMLDLVEIARTLDKDFLVNNK